MKTVLFGALLILPLGTATAQVGPPCCTGAPGSTVAPGNTNPETDARGIPVISAPAVAPAGWNAPLGQAAAPASGPAPSMGAATDLPPCSRTSTACVARRDGRVPRPPR
jgi:hypothetical protein